MIIDTHAHINFKAFKDTSDEIIKKTLAEDIWIVNVGTKYETSEAAVLLAEKYAEGVYATIGLHPMFAAAEFVKLRTDPDEGEFLLKEQEFDKEKYRALAKSKKVVAIGEIGLDYYYRPKTTAKLEEFKAKQKRIFQEQLDLAKELDLPVMLHCRMAHDDVIEILQGQTFKGGVVHCFTGTLEQAQKYIALGFYIGINGIIFKFNIDEVIKTISLDNIVVETDAPYLTPAPEEGKKNEPIFIKHTIQKIAELKGVSFEEAVHTTTQNAKKLFNI